MTVSFKISGRSLRQSDGMKPGEVVLALILW